MTDQPDLHQTILPCNHAHLRQTHVPHSWEPQPGVQPVFCTGYVPDDGQWHYDTPPRGSSPNRWRTPALGSALPGITYRPVTPKMEQAATQRAVEAAQQRESEQVGVTLGSNPERPTSGRATADTITDAELDALYETVQRLNARAQRAESTVNTLHRAVAQWDVSDRGTYP